MSNRSFFAIGLMSGSSLDGLDIAYVHFLQNETTFSYQLLQTDYIPYTDDFISQLRDASKLSGLELMRLNKQLGKFFGIATEKFISQYAISKVDYIASHGQTIFHQPQGGFTTQLGCGATIAATTFIPTIVDLRSIDMAYGGQGAPIVPITEKYLFPNIDVFLNIGGITNIAIHERNTNQVIAYDIGVGNTLLNLLAQQIGKKYDDNGDIARSGKVDDELLSSLNNISYCKQPAPKSLGTEYILEQWMPIVQKSSIPLEDKLATSVVHIAQQIANALKQNTTVNQMMLTGGGALNSYLVEQIQQHTSVTIIVPDLATVQYKEALAMAFFGLLRWLELPNCIPSVTGASKESIGGCIYLP